MSDYQQIPPDQTSQSSTSSSTSNQTTQQTNQPEKDPLQEILHSGFRTFKKTQVSLVALLLVLGVSLSVFSSMQQTNIFQRASGPTPTVGTLPSPIITNLNSTSDTLATINQDGTMGPQSAVGNWSNALKSSQKGKLAFTVQANNTHDPLTAVNLTITKVEVHITSQQGKAVDHWETLNVTTPVVVDLVQLSRIKSLSTFGLTDLAAGQYAEARFYIKSATVKLFDGSTIQLRIFGKNNIVRVVKSFAVTPDQTTNLTITFDAAQSILEANGQYLLRPFVSQMTEEKK